MSDMNSMLGFEQLDLVHDKSLDPNEKNASIEEEEKHPPPVPKAQFDDN